MAHSRSHPGLQHVAECLLGEHKRRGKFPPPAALLKRIPSALPEEGCWEQLWLPAASEFPQHKRESEKRVKCCSQEMIIAMHCLSAPLEGAINKNALIQLFSRTVPRSLSLAGSKLCAVKHIS